MLRASCPGTAQTSSFDVWRNSGGEEALRRVSIDPRCQVRPEERGIKAMRSLSARWALFGLAIVMLVGYGLNRGILVGSRIETARLSDNYPVPFYKKHCRYLFFNGIQQVWTSSESTREEAESSSCAPLKNEPVIHRRRKSSS
jgi:hypothetical protein